ncbi:hypothetical protein B4Q13_19080, partial [Lacticaseibacillus rhamnosus]
DLYAWDAESTYIQEPPFFAGLPPSPRPLADIVDVARRLAIEFRSTRITGAASDWQLEGDLTIGDVTRPVTLAVEFGGIETFPGAGRHAGFEATTQIRRKDFGIHVKLPPGVSGALLGDTIKIEIDRESEATKKLYGEGIFAKQCLGARRLVEAGVPTKVVVNPPLRAWRCGVDASAR